MAGCRDCGVIVAVFVGVIVRVNAHVLEIVKEFIPRCLARGLHLCIGKLKCSLKTEY